jgi:predicted  nucleic acid-binding Zn-ribbon protein
MITPDRIEAWRRTAAIGATTGSPSGNALLDACDEIKELQAKVDRTVQQATDHIGDALRRLDEAEADRDRARDAAVALEQENAQLQDVLNATDQIELSTRKDVAQARDAVYEGRSGEALDMLSDLLESLGGKR